MTAAAAKACCRYHRCVELYADNELDADHVMDVEEHLLRCSPCAERYELLRSTRTSLKRCCGATAAPDALRQRMTALLQSTTVASPSDSSKDSNNSLDGQALPSGATQSGEGRVWGSLHTSTPQTADDRRGTDGAKLIPLRYAVAMAAAAGIAFAMGAYRSPEGAQAEGETGPAARGFQTADLHGQASNAVPRSLDGMLEDLVELHARPLPPETTNPEEVPEFGRIVGVPVRRPAFQPLGEFDGARVHAVRDRRAAVLHYKLKDGHRVTMYVYDSRAFPVQATKLRPVLVRQRPVYVGSLRGFSVAATEDEGVGYAVASDLDRDESAKMVLAVAQ